MPNALKEKRVISPPCLLGAGGGDVGFWPPEMFILSKMVSGAAVEKRS